MGMARKIKRKSMNSFTIISTKYLAILLSLTPLYSFTQECNDGSRLLLPNERFQIINQNIVRDSVTHLIWKRCPLGETFIADSCKNNINSSLLNWQGVQNAMADINEDKSHLNWRVPSIDELATLIETTCKEPATNTLIFPLRKNVTFWSNSSYSLDKNYYWIVNFSTGEQLTIQQESTSHLLRLVNSEVSYTKPKDESSDNRQTLKEWEDGIHDLDNLSLPQLQKFSDATNKFPHDQYSNVDWSKTNKDGFIQPKKSFDLKNIGSEVTFLQSELLYKNTDDSDWVTFGHKQHAEWLACNSCHRQNTSIDQPDFDAELQKVHTGKQCGMCHGKVAFSLDNCTKCHNTKKH